jgi:acetylornithine/succinyldiaminopimelate/putrescine aminotransferase
MLHVNWESLPLQQVRSWHTGWQCQSSDPCTNGDACIESHLGPTYVFPWYSAATGKGDIVRLVPPLVVTKDEIKTCAQVLASALQKISTR